MIGIFLISSCTMLFAQSSAFEEIEEHFEKFSISHIESSSLATTLKDKSAFHQVQFKLGSESFEMELWDSGLLSDDFFIKYSNPEYIIGIISSYVNYIT